ncbi:MAG: RNB domain-containing ribonuclease [Microbacteriaceae bacterium]
MPSPSLRLSRPTEGELARALSAIPSRLGLSREFPAGVVAAAQHAVEAHILPEEDLTALNFVTVDPEGATDLDQAFLLERSETGYLVHYAIADVAAFVQPGGVLDTESRRRGQTIYAPDGRIPLHPREISENAASLMPGVVRGAYVWKFELDGNANVIDVKLTRAQILSRAQHTYSSLNDPLLGEIGAKRQNLERQRGGASLTLPETEIELRDGTYTLIRRQPRATESWNAQLSLMTGMAAAQLMLTAGVGIVRTMPPAEASAIDEFRQQTRALGHPWSTDVPYGDYLRSLDTNKPQELAIMHAAASLFRGAGYTVFDGEAPDVTMQAAVGAPYAHATAPLRRLVDRFVLAACEAISNDRPVPDWVRDALPELPATMTASGTVAGNVDRASIDTVEAAELSLRIGEIFEVTVISVRGNTARIQLADPAVAAQCTGELEVGSVVWARLDVADISTGEVRFTAV